MLHGINRIEFCNSPLFDGDIMSDQRKTFHNTQKVKNIPKSRKLYRKPHLQELGDLRSLTLGGSPGVGDSSNQFTQQPPGAPPGSSPLLPPEF